ncbi:glycosyltransferase [Acinetobacter sp. SA01]|uniref:glycosyltransferase n=1 Tax=Acinetobacter sp. SA01 TaxID=1862567 RepID=UPI001408E0F2|nr:glycosyltransferase [Acinetobacter sp. SA01]
MFNKDIRKIDGDLTFFKSYTFCTLVTKFDEYMDMVESAKKAGFDGDDIEFLYFDNKNENKFDGYSGINRALKEAKGRYLIFCHQDILFKHDNRAILDQRIKELEVLDRDWAVLGNAGKTKSGNTSIRISDPNFLNLREGIFPREVMSLDENFLIINRKHNLSTTEHLLKGFHLYAIDLCQNSENLGLKNYVIDFHLFHKSPGNVDESYFTAQKKYIDMQYNRKRPQFFWAMCSNFYVSNNSLKNIFFNFKRIIRLSRSILKKIDKM